MNTYKILVFTFALVLGLAINPLQTLFNGQLEIPAAQAGDCSQTQTPKECNRATNGRTWKGEGTIANPIQVTICHGYWDQIDVGTYRGVKTKHYSPVMQYGNWYGDLKVVTSQCKLFEVKPGTIIKLYASCVERVISTGLMMRAGQYVMK